MKLIAGLLLVAAVVAGGLFLFFKYHGRLDAKLAAPAFAANAPKPPVRSSYSGHSRSVRSLAFSPDGLTLVSSSDDETVRLWDQKSGTQRQSIELPGGPVS